MQRYSQNYKTLKCYSKVLPKVKHIRHFDEKLNLEVFDVIPYITFPIRIWRERYMRSKLSKSPKRKHFCFRIASSHTLQFIITLCEFTRRTRMVSIKSVFIFSLHSRLVEIHTLAIIIFFNFAKPVVMTITPSSLIFLLCQVIHVTSVGWCQHQFPPVTDQKLFTGH